MANLNSSVENINAIEWLESHNFKKLTRPDVYYSDINGFWIINTGDKKVQVIVIDNNGEKQEYLITNVALFGDAANIITNIYCGYEYILDYKYV
jgi:ribosomal protein S18 acetylase RimI-like enzyme